MACWIRFWSTNTGGSPGCNSASISTSRPSTSVRATRTASVRISTEGVQERESFSLPASRRARSSTSVSKRISSSALLRITSTLSRAPSLSSPSRPCSRTCENPTMEFNGLRSSWLIDAMKRVRSSRASAIWSRERASPATSSASCSARTARSRARTSSSGSRKLGGGGHTTASGRTSMRSTQAAKRSTSSFRPRAWVTTNPATATDASSEAAASHADPCTALAASPTASTGEACPSAARAVVASSSSGVIHRAQTRSTSGASSATTESVASAGRFGPRTTRGATESPLATKGMLAAASEGLIPARPNLSRTAHTAPSVEVASRSSPALTTTTRIPSAAASTTSAAVWSDVSASPEASARTKSTRALELPRSLIRRAPGAGSRGTRCPPRADSPPRSGPRASRPDRG